ncbi:MAG: DegV family protein [Lachnospiraceae bacterium]|nr:DegV family protein [Lachnospiraceae bacterium]MBD5455332.1 DegV family protein [Lachnospiraceae bacterium]
MKEAYQIISDGSCDLPPQLVQEKNVTVVPFYVSFDEVHYQKEIEEIGIRDFYQKMVEEPKIYPKSSMPSTQDYIDAFIPFVKQEIPIICICITTKFSGSMQSAMNAGNMILEDYPNARITVIDATINTVLQGLYVLEAVRLRDSGAGYEETVNRLEEIKSTGRIFFTVGNMEYLQHGGRIGKVAGIAGSILGIKPIITLKQGEIFPSGIARSRRKSMEKTIDLILNYLEEMKEPIDHFSIAVGYGYDYEESVAYRDMVLNVLKEKYGLQELPIYQIGATIGVHTGPYPLGLGIVRRSIIPMGK